MIETAYDDGGLSGGSLDRPALQRLFADIARHQVDTVVVYKVDRLTRSLMDFAKIVELFDRHGTSFVAVTQQFNTTTSMGRLPPSTSSYRFSLSSSARSSASGSATRSPPPRRRSMWMGGVAPLGYAVQERKLVIVPEEAETVRLIFNRYQQLGSVRRLKDELDRKGIRSKQRIHGNGSHSGGQPFSRGALYALLSNPIYIGEIAHKGARYPGQHQAILDRETWDSAQDQLRNAGPEQRGRTCCNAQPAGRQGLR